MFKPHPTLTDTSDEENNIKDVWNWWRTGKRAKYPSTLWVTVEPVTPPSSSEPTLRSMVPTQPEMGQQLGMALDTVTSGQVRIGFFYKMKGKIFNFYNSGRKYSFGDMV